mmetsp:Transcript_15727/g.17033  ORF Transcript_15727/g.17033 Transcript_15727/m.17033 type:complete len:145 (-) Transcript_15727:154-588(-)|eukprot:gene17247-19770_t
MTATMLGFNPSLMTEKLSSFLPPIRLSFTNKPTELSLMFDAGVQYVEDGKYAEAKERFDQCLAELQYGVEGVQFSKDQTDRYIVPILCHLATCHMELRQYAKTAQYCEQVLQRRPSHKKALYLQSMANIEMGSFKAAMKYYKKK